MLFGTISEDAANMAGSAVAKIITPELLTVAGTLAAAFVGWKAIAKTWGMTKFFAQQCSFVGLTTAVLFVLGLSSAGVGTGEVIARITEKNPAGMSNNEIIKLSESCKDPIVAKMVLEYAQLRDLRHDGSNSNIDRLITLAEKSTPENRETIVSLIKYVQSREERETEKKTSSSNEQFVKLETNEQTKNSFTMPFTKIDPVTGEKSSLFSLQGAIALLFSGLGVCAVAVVVYKNKSVSKPMKSENKTINGPNGSPVVFDSFGFVPANQQKKS